MVKGGKRGEWVRVGKRGRVKGGKRWKGKDGVTGKELGNMLWVGKGVRVKGREKGKG